MRLSRTRLPGFNGLYSEAPRERTSGYRRLVNAPQLHLRKFVGKTLTGVETGPVSMSSSHDITRLLQQWAGGSSDALEELTPLIYHELRQLADSYLRRESRAQTMQPTALVHEAYLRLVDQHSPDWENRSHFFGIAARIMRQILVDHARSQQSPKRGGALERVSLEDCLNSTTEYSADLISLNDALNELERFDPRKAKIIDLHFFGGLTVQETAAALGISKATVERELRAGEAWLYNRVKGQPS